MFHCWELSEFKLSLSIEFVLIFFVDSVIFELNLGVGEEDSHGFGSGVDVEVVEFDAHIFVLEIEDI
jgi:hypothetical protein